MWWKRVKSASQNYNSWRAINRLGPIFLFRKNYIIYNIYKSFKRSQSLFSLNICRNQNTVLSFTILFHCFVISGPSYKCSLSNKRIKIFSSFPQSILLISLINLVNSLQNLVNMSFYHIFGTQGQRSVQHTLGFGLTCLQRDSWNCALPNCAGDCLHCL